MKANQSENGKRLIIIGAGGHGKVIADIALKNGYRDICFVDDEISESSLGFPVIGGICDVKHLINNETEFIIAIGNNAIRKKIAEECNLNWITLIHPSAQIGFNVSIGKGTVVMAGAIINPNTIIGKHCIINSGAIVEHDNLLEDYVHVSPQTALGGTVTVGECTHIGIGAIVKNNVNICRDCVIGAGAVVVNTISRRGGVFIGVPARIKE